MHFFRDQNILLSTKMEMVFSNSRPGIQWWHSLKVKNIYVAISVITKKIKCFLIFLCNRLHQKENLMVKILDSRGWDKQYMESQCYNIRSSNYEKIYLITKINEPFTCFICWADITSKPKNCIFMLFYICLKW